MAKIKQTRQMNGTFGSLWVNGDKWMDIESFEAKVNVDFEDVNMAEDLATHKKMLGWNGEGSLTVKKVYSRGASIMSEAVKSGVMPDIEMIGKLADPDAFGSERVSLSEITFNDFTLLKFEQKTRMTEELSFNFASYDLIDYVNS